MWNLNAKGRLSFVVGEGKPNGAEYVGLSGASNRMKLGRVRRSGVVYETSISRSR